MTLKFVHFFINNLLLVYGLVLSNSRYSIAEIDQIAIAPQYTISYLVQSVVK